MKPTGIVRKIDDLGRLVIPVAVREQLNICEGDEFDLFLDDDCVIWQKQSKINIINNALKWLERGVDKNLPRTAWREDIYKKIDEIRDINIHNFDDYEEV